MACCADCSRKEKLVKAGIVVGVLVLLYLVCKKWK